MSVSSASTASGAVSARSTRGPSVHRQEAGASAAASSAGAQAAFRAGQQGDGRRRRPRPAQRPRAGLQRQQQARAAHRRSRRCDAASLLPSHSASFARRESAARGCARTARRRRWPWPANAPASSRRARRRGLQHAALGHQRLDAGRAEFGGLFDQPVHALVGRHADAPGARRAPLRARRAWCAPTCTCTSLRPMRSTVASYSPPAAVEQRDGVARLQAQHLHVARGAGRQASAVPVASGTGQ